MKNAITIPIYKNIDGEFQIIDENKYSITYLKGTKIHQLRIVVNGILSKSIINVITNKLEKKNAILQAISDYNNGFLSTNNKVTKELKLDTVKQFYSKTIVRNIEKYLLPINKETSRDVLTKFKLIKQDV